MAGKIRSTGRNSGRTVLKNRGRPQTPLIDRIAVKAWFNALMISCGAENAYQVAVKYDKTLDSKRFEKYARGAVRPNHTTLTLIDKNLVSEGFTKVRVVFDDGPDGAPLWNALSGNFEDLWKIIDNTTPEMPALRVLLATHEGRVNQFINAFAPGVAFKVMQNLDSQTEPPGTPVSELDRIEDRLATLEIEHLNHLHSLEMDRQSLIRQKISDEASSNPASAELLIKEEEVRKSRFEEEMVRRSNFHTGSTLTEATIRSEWRNQFSQHFSSKQSAPKITFSQLAATIALWRLSLLISESFSRLDDLMYVLIRDVIPDMLKEYGVAEDVIELLESIQSSLRRLRYQ